MNLERIILRMITMKLKKPFHTSQGSIYEKPTILIEVQDENGISGWGECVALPENFYTEETVDVAYHILENELIPRIDKKILHPDEITDRIFKNIVGNPMAKSGVEGAIWDLYAKQQNASLSKLLGGVQNEIDAGASIGLEESIEKTIETIQEKVYQGYKRVKLKIKPQMDIELLERVRAVFPKVPLMVDANGSYDAQDMDTLKQFDTYNLLMIEQPFPSKKLELHAQLQSMIQTPICLDESIVDLSTLQLAHQLGCMGIVNLKIGRVGGITTSLRMHEYCQNHQIPLWCGGMFETGIGRAHNLAIGSLKQFIYPQDMQSSSHYWERDIISPLVIQNGTIPVPNAPGIGVEPDQTFIDTITTKRKEWVLK